MCGVKTEGLIGLFVVANLCCGTGCRRPAPTTVGGASTSLNAAPTEPQLPRSTTNPTTLPALMTFGGAKQGITIEYPGSWTSRPNPDFELMIIPPGAVPSRYISLDVPELPMHIPGLIPIGSVQSGYVDDVKKQFGNVQVTQITAPSMAKSSVRMVRCTGQQGGREIVDIALLAVRVPY